MRGRGKQTMTQELIFIKPSDEMLQRNECLAGIPTAGIEVPAELANEWLDHGLAELITPAIPVVEET